MFRKFVKPAVTAVFAALVALGFCLQPARAQVYEIDNNGQMEPAVLTAKTLPQAPKSVNMEYLPSVTAKIMPPHWKIIVTTIANRHDLDPKLFEALVWQESRWNPSAYSPKGAIGLAQLMPGTARELGVDPHDPVANLDGGAQYLKRMLGSFGGDVTLALAAYNAGPKRVQVYKAVPPFAETQNYVAAIQQRVAWGRALEE